MPARLRERYRTEVVGKLRERFQYRNVMEVPRVEKVVINVRVGGAVRIRGRLTRSSRRSC